MRSFDFVVCVVIAPAELVVVLLLLPLARPPVEGVKGREEEVVDGEEVEEHVGGVFGVITGPELSIAICL